MHELLKNADWDKLLDESLEDFRTLLRFETIDPPGNELEAAGWLADKLRAEGLEPQVLESAPGRGNMVCRIKGRGGKKPLLLNSHLDVVGVETDKWDHPPFEAVIDDGYLFGRGTIDMKNMTAMSLAAMLYIKRNNIELDRDVIMVGCADEEAGSEWGSRWLAKEHPELVTAEYVLNEIGAFTLHFGGERIYPIQVAEKGICWCTVSCEGEPGHGSLPAPDAALPRLAEAAAKIATVRFPQHNIPVVVSFIDQLIDGQKGAIKFMLPLLKIGFLAPILLKAFPDKSIARAFDSYLRHTANPTIFTAGSKVNVVPGRAELKVDGRILPGYGPEDFVRELRAIIGKGFDIQVDRTHQGVESDAKDPVVGVLREVLSEHDPGSRSVTNLVPGFTDNPPYAALGAKCYGFSPVKIEEGLNFSKLYHGHNERISVDGYKWGVKVLLDAVMRIAA